MFICSFEQSVEPSYRRYRATLLPGVKSSPQVNRPVYRREIDEAPFTILPLVTDMKYGRARVHGAGRRFHGNPGQATLLLLPDICLRRTYTHTRTCSIRFATVARENILHTRRNFFINML